MYRTDGALCREKICEEDGLENPILKKCPDKEGKYYANLLCFMHLVGKNKLSRQNPHAPRYPAVIFHYPPVIIAPAKPILKKCPDKEGKYYANLWAANRLALLQAGVLEEDRGTDHNNKVIRKTPKFLLHKVNHPPCNLRLVSIK